MLYCYQYTWECNILSITDFIGKNTGKQSPLERRHQAE